MWKHHANPAHSPTLAPPPSTVQACMVAPTYLEFKELLTLCGRQVDEDVFASLVAMMSVDGHVGVCGICHAVDVLTYDNTFVCHGVH